MNLNRLSTLGCPPRDEQAGETWDRCCRQERAYTLGFRAGRIGVESLVRVAGSVAGACPFAPSDERREFWLLGMNDGARVRERRAAK